MTHGGYRPGSGRKMGTTPPMEPYTLKLPTDVVDGIPSRQWAQELVTKAVKELSHEDQNSEST